MKTAAALLLFVNILALAADGEAGGRRYRVGRANADTMGFPVQGDYDAATGTCRVSFPAEVRRADGSPGVLARAELAVAEPLVEVDVTARELPGATPRRQVLVRLAKELLGEAKLRLHFRYESLDAEDLFELDLEELTSGAAQPPLTNPHSR